jgi:hypothetical protein
MPADFIPLSAKLRHIRARVSRHSVLSLPHLGQGSGGMRIHSASAPRSAISFARSISK